MAHAKPPRLPPRVRQELEGLNWSMQLGTRHWQIRVDGKMVAIWPRASNVGEISRNVHATITAIRRARRTSCHG